MTRVAAVDCGTNSIRLLVADVSSTGTLTDVLRRTEIVRLGQGVDRTGRIASESMRRTLTMAREYAGQCRELGARRVRFVATSASRDAQNATEFTNGVRAAFGDLDVVPEVIGGLEEAALSFRGATADLVAAHARQPFLVVDLGGGSTEFVRGSCEHDVPPRTGAGHDDPPAGTRCGGSQAAQQVRVDEAISTRMGCVRFTERHLHSDPPTADEIAAAESQIEQLIDQAARVVRLDDVGTLVGLAGSVTTVTAYGLGLTRYDAARLHGSALPVDQVVSACDGMLHATRAERAAMGFMHPGRVDVIGSGALIWRCIVRRVAAASGIREVVASEKDILDGVAVSLASS